MTEFLCTIEDSLRLCLEEHSFYWFCQWYYAEYAQLDEAYAMGVVTEFKSQINLDVDWRGEIEDRIRTIDKQTSRYQKAGRSLLKQINTLFKKKNGGRALQILMDLTRTGGRSFDANDVPTDAASTLLDFWLILEISCKPFPKFYSEPVNGEADAPVSNGASLTEHDFVRELRGIDFHPDAHSLLLHQLVYVLRNPDVNEYVTRMRLEFIMQSNITDSYLLSEQKVKATVHSRRRRQV